MLSSEEKKSVRQMRRSGRTMAEIKYKLKASKKRKKKSSKKRKKKVNLVKMMKPKSMY